MKQCFDAFDYDLKLGVDLRVSFHSSGVGDFVSNRNIYRPERHLNGLAAPLLLQLRKTFKSFATTISLRENGINCTM